MKAKITIRNVLNYLQGTIRYKLYYSWAKCLIRKHIIEQIDYRISVMDSDCYYNGTCTICGCTTTALQMCDKACDKPCYPKMMNKKEWELYKSNNKTNYKS